MQKGLRLSAWQSALVDSYSLDTPSGFYVWRYDPRVGMTVALAHLAVKLAQGGGARVWVYPGGYSGSSAWWERTLLQKGLWCNTNWPMHDVSRQEVVVVRKARITDLIDTSKLSDDPFFIIADNVRDVVQGPARIVGAIREQYPYRKFVVICSWREQRWYLSTWGTPGDDVCPDYLDTGGCWTPESHRRWPGVFQAQVLQLLLMHRFGGGACRLSLLDKPVVFMIITTLAMQCAFPRREATMTSSHVWPAEPRRRNAIASFFQETLLRDADDGDDE